MTPKFSFGEIQLDVKPGSGKAAAGHEPGLPFILAIVADFSGRANHRLIEPVSQRRTSRVDCDNFEAIVAGLDARLELIGPASETLRLQFGSLDDFHPDRLLQVVPSLAGLLSARRRLLSPSTTGDAARELQTLLAAQAPPAEPQPSKASATESDRDTLARLLGGTAPTNPPSQTEPATGVEKLIRNIVAPSIVPGASPQQAALLSAVDLELTRRLRWILHHPDFQALESAWRGLDLLVRNLGAEENLKICLVDISKQEIAADLMAQENLEASGFGRLLQRHMEEQRWGVWIGHYTFGATVREIELLGRLAKLAAGAGVPFLAAASPSLAGCDSFGSHPEPGDWKQPLEAEAAAGWAALRELPDAAYAALCLPRFLLRQPYGQQSDPIDSFAFEEMSADVPHEHYLWGNSAVLCGSLLAEAFQAEGWDMRPSGVGEVGELPLHKFKENGETVVKPCAEAWLNQRAADSLAERGLLPVLSVKGRNAVRLGPLRSLRRSTALLAGHWDERSER